MTNDACAGWTAVFAAEATFFVVLVDFWAEGAVPMAALRMLYYLIPTVDD
jgi:yeast amino acid transporter